MSLDATRWAWQQQGLKASEKLVLLAIADRAGEAMTAHPSIQRMERDTCLNRKTIITCFDSLEAKGLIADTGRRVGQTAKVKVYQLLGVKDRHANDPEIGTVRKNSAANSNSAKNGTIKKSQKRDHSTGEIVPILDGNGTENGTLNSPKNGTQNLPVEPTKEPYFKGLDFSAWPEIPDKQILNDWKKLRQAKKAPITQTVIDNFAKPLIELASMGYSVNTVLAEVCDAGWTGLKTDWYLNRIGGNRNAASRSTHPQGAKPCLDPDDTSWIDPLFDPQGMGGATTESCVPPIEGDFSRLDGGDEDAGTGSGNEAPMAARSGGRRY